MKQVMWGLVALGVFTGGWAIGCAVIGAQYMNEGKTFKPPARQPEASHAGR